MDGLCNGAKQLIQSAALVDLLQQEKQLTVLFASPSAVEVFAEEVAPQMGWDGLYDRGNWPCDGKSVARSWCGCSCEARYIHIDGSRREIGGTKGRVILENLQFRRNRRLRNSATLRSMVRETVLRKEDFIYPIFVIEGENIKNPVSSMPGVFQFSLDQLAIEIDEVVALGIPSVILFGVPAEKDATWYRAYHDQGIVQQATRFVKERHPELVVIADTCLCEYTDHGHCGVVEGGKVLNDPSLELLVRTAVSQAKAGADIIAPSNMMDGFVVAIRQGLGCGRF